MVNNLPARWETWVQSLAWEDPLEKGMTTHSSILAWRIHMDRGAWWPTVHGVAKSWTRLSNFTFTLMSAPATVSGGRMSLDKDKMSWEE